MSGLTRVRVIGPNVVNFQDKEGRTAVSIATAMGARRIWLEHPGVSQVELTGADARLIAEGLWAAAKRLDEIC